MKIEQNFRIDQQFKIQVQSAIIRPFDRMHMKRACPGRWPRCARARALHICCGQQTRSLQLPRHFTCTRVSCLPPDLHSACHVIRGPGSWARFRHQIRTRGARCACERASRDTRPPHFPLYIFSCAACLFGVWGCHGLELSWSRVFMVICVFLVIKYVLYIAATSNEFFFVEYWITVYGDLEFRLSGVVDL